MTYEVKFSKASEVAPSPAYIGFLIDEQTKNVKQIIPLHDLELAPEGKHREMPFSVKI